jgi:hypothetical protein
MMSINNQKQSIHPQSYMEFTPFMSPDSLRQFYRMNRAFFDSHTKKSYGRTDIEGSQYVGTCENFGNEILMETRKMKMNKPSLKRLRLPNMFEFYFELEHSELINTYDQQNLMCVKLREDALLDNNREYRICLPNPIRKNAYRSKSTSDGNVYRESYMSTTRPVELHIRNVTTGETQRIPFNITDRKRSVAAAYNLFQTIHVRNLGETEQEHYQRFLVRQDEFINRVETQIEYCFFLNTIDSDLIESNTTDGLITKPLTEEMIGRTIFWMMSTSYRNLPFINFQTTDLNGSIVNADLLVVGCNGHHKHWAYPVLNDNLDTYIKVTPFFDRFAQECETFEQEKYNGSIGIEKIEFLKFPAGADPNGVVSPISGFVVDHMEDFVRIHLCEPAEWNFRRAKPGDWDYIDPKQPQECHDSLCKHDGDMISNIIHPDSKVERIIPNRFPGKNNEFVENIDENWVTAWRPLSTFATNVPGINDDECPMLPAFQVIFNHMFLHDHEVQMGNAVCGIHIGQKSTKDNGIIKKKGIVYGLGDFDGLPEDLDVNVEMYSIRDELNNDLQTITDKQVTSLFLGDGELARCYWISNDDTEYRNNHLVPFPKPECTTAYISDLPTDARGLISIPNIAPTLITDTEYVSQNAPWTNDLQEKIWNELPDRWVRKQVNDEWINILSCDDDLDYSFPPEKLEQTHGVRVNLNPIIDLRETDLRWSVDPNNRGTGYAFGDNFDFYAGGIAVRGIVTSVHANGGLNGFTLSFPTDATINMRNLDGAITSFPIFAKPSFLSKNEPPWCDCSGGKGGAILLDNPNWSSIDSHNNGEILDGLYAFKFDQFDNVWVYTFNLETRRWVIGEQLIGEPYLWNEYEDPKTWEYRKTYTGLMNDISMNKRISEKAFGIGSKYVSIDPTDAIDINSNVPLSIDINTAVDHSKLIVNVNRQNSLYSLVSARSDSDEFHRLRRIGFNRYWPNAPRETYHPFNDMEYNVGVRIQPSNPGLNIIPRNHGVNLEEYYNRSNMLVYNFYNYTAPNVEHPPFITLINRMEVAGEYKIDYAPGSRTLRDGEVARFTLFGIARYNLQGMVLSDGESIETALNAIDLLGDDQSVYFKSFIDSGHLRGFIDFVPLLSHTPFEYRNQPIVIRLTIDRHRWNSQFNRVQPTMGVFNPFKAKVQQFQTYIGPHSTTIIDEDEITFHNTIGRLSDIGEIYEMPCENGILNKNVYSYDERLEQSEVAQLRSIIERMDRSQLIEYVKTNFGSDATPLMYENETFAWTPRELMNWIISHKRPDPIYKRNDIRLLRPKWDTVATRVNAGGKVTGVGEQPIGGYEIINNDVFDTDIRLNGNRINVNIQFIFRFDFEEFPNGAPSLGDFRLYNHDIDISEVSILIHKNRMYIFNASTEEWRRIILEKKESNDGS